MKTSLLRSLPSLAALAAFALTPLAVNAAEAAPENGGPITVTGEVLDMACYLDHGAHGAGHADCATKCISNGLPVGLKATDGSTNLLIGEHMPANEELAQYAAKTITVHGKFVERDGIKMIENIEIDHS